MSNFLLFLVLEITSGGWVALAPSYIAVYPDTIVVEWTRDGLQPIRLLIFSFCCNFNYHFLIEKYNKKTTKAGKPWVFECGQVNLVSDVNNVSALPSPVLSIHPCDTRKPYYPYYSTDLPPVNTSSSLVTDFIPVVSFWYETADTKIGNLEENLLVNGNWDCYDGGITYPFTHRLPYDLRGIFLSIFTDDEDYQPNPVHLSFVEGDYNWSEFSEEYRSIIESSLLSLYGCDFVALPFPMVLDDVYVYPEFPNCKTSEKFAVILYWETGETDPESGWPIYREEGKECLFVDSPPFLFTHHIRSSNRDGSWYKSVSSTQNVCNEFYVYDVIPEDQYPSGSVESSISFEIPSFQMNISVLRYPAVNDLPSFYFKYSSNNRMKVIDNSSGSVGSSLTTPPSGWPMPDGAQTFLIEPGPFCPEEYNFFKDVINFCSTGFYSIIGRSSHPSLRQSYFYDQVYGISSRVDVPFPVSDQDWFYEEGQLPPPGDCTYTVTFSLSLELGLPIVVDGVEIAEMTLTIKLAEQKITFTAEEGLQVLLTVSAEVVASGIEMIVNSGAELIVLYTYPPLAVIFRLIEVVIDSEGVTADCP